MNKSLFLLLVLLLSGCATFQVSTLNHDPIYSFEGSDAKITIINNEFELDRLLRTDFRFRYDYAQYALRQPISFDWNNRYVRFNRFNRSTNFWYSNWNYGYSYAPWDRHQMWNDWIWGFPYGGGIGWFYSWNNRRWSSNYWGNTYGWNNYYGWGNGYKNSNNVVINTNRRGKTTNTNSRRIIKQRVTTVTPPRKVVTPKIRRVITNKPRVIRNKPVINNRRPQPTRIKRTTPKNTQPARKVNSKREN